MELIRTEALYKSYSKGDITVEVLKGIDVSIQRGETVAILGASGVGKSTFLNILGALDRPTSGQVYYRDEPLFTMGERNLAEFRNRKIGFVFQFHHLLPEFSALENVMLPALIGGVSFDEARGRAERLLKEVGLEKRLTHRPGELSGGEQQRVSLVRALVQTPEVILADEPTGNLDSKTGMEVIELLLGFNREKDITIVIVTHNEKIASLMSRRLEMVDGKIINA